jgi:hypothetical protein
MSEILKEYAKIAVAQGLVDMETPTGGTEKKPPRYDSLTWDDIQMLYGVKPEGTEECVLDKAHPDTYVAGRAYDAMNAVVENLHQRQNVMADIALRDPDGLLTQKRYIKARQDLMNSLVSVGFEMDSRDETRLMKMADSCAGRLQKVAIEPMTVGIIAGVAALALLGWAGYADDAVQGVYQNAQAVIDQAQDMAEEGVGWVTDLISEMTTLQRYAAQFSEVADEMMAATGGKLTPQSVTNVTHGRQDLLNKAKQYEAVLRAEKRNLPIWMGKLKYQREMFTAQEGSWNITQRLKQMWGTVFDTEADDLSESLGGLSKTIDATLKQISTIRMQSGKHAKSLERAEQEFRARQQGPGTQQTTMPQAQPQLMNLEQAAGGPAAPAQGPALEPYKG